jgi:hypothetical protein
MATRERGGDMADQATRATEAMVKIPDAEIRESQGVPSAMMRELASYWGTHYDLRRYGSKPNANKLDRGNHFAAWQESELFTAELRSAFRSLR